MKNPIAELDKPDSLKFIKPEDTDYENNEKGYYCPDNACLDPERKLYLKKSTLGNLYFSHGSGFDHELNAENLFHKLVIADIMNRDHFTFPSQSFFDKSNTIEIDHSKSKVIKFEKKGVNPDIMLVSKNNDQFYIEVNISTPTDNEKIIKAKEENIPFLSLDLRNFYNLNQEKLQNDIDFMLQSVKSLAIENDNKSWIFKPKTEKSLKDFLTKKNMIGAAVFGAVALVAGYFIKKD